MRYLLPTLLALSTALHAADEAAPAKGKKLPAVSVLPNGSELQDVLIPRHNENYELVSSMRAKLITLVNDEMIAGKTVLIDFYNPDGSKKAHIDLVEATFNQVRGIVKSSDPVKIESENFRAKGSGVHYAFNQGEGFLTGPATTWIVQPQPQETSMNTRPSLLGAAAAAMLSQVSTTIATEEHPAPSEAQTQHTERAKEARSTLRDDLEKSKKAIEQTEAFLKQADIADQTGPAPEPVEAKPLDFNPAPTDTVITCEGGMYFDADKGVFVYLKNVKVKDPRFDLSGANELKIFLSPKSADKKPGTAEDPKKSPNVEEGAKKPDSKENPKENSGDMNLSGKFGDVERIIATGAVRILQKDVEKGKLPVEASGAIFTYRPATGLILLSGGYPWVKQGNTFMRAKEPNLTLRIEKSGSFVTEGNWDMGGNLNDN